MSRKNFIYFFTYIFINIALIIIASWNMRTINVVDWMSFIQIIITIGLSILINKKVISVFNIFILLTYLFHFGQAIIRIFPFEDPLFDRSVLAKVGIDILAKSEQFGIICIFAITIGYVIFQNNPTPKEIKSTMNSYNQVELLRVRSLAIIILGISVFPMLYIDLLKIFSLSSGGYESTYLVYQNGLGKYLGLIGQFCKPVFPLLIYANKDKIKKATTIFVVSSLYLALIMVSGDRGTSLIYILTNIFVFLTFVKQMRFITCIFGVILSYFGLGIISAISVFRYGDFSVAGFIDAFLLRNADGIFYSMLRELGGSMLTLAHAISYIPQYSTWGLGLTYITSIFWVSPWLPDFVSDNLVNYVSFIHTFPSSAVDFVSLGGSFLGEAFYNFGYCAPIFLIFLGAFIKKIDNSFKNEISVRKTAVYIVLLPSLFLWVRDFYVNLVFKTFWIGIVILYIKVKKNEKSIDNNNR